MSFIFWASSFNELSNPNHTTKAFVGNWVVCTQLVQLLVMGDFIYHYIRCIRQALDSFRGHISCARVSRCPSSCVRTTSRWSGRAYSPKRG